MDELHKVAYAMGKAYRNSKDRQTACALVSVHFPDVDKKILLAMWQAIDAYVDLNVPY